MKNNLLYLLIVAILLFGCVHHTSQLQPGQFSYSFKKQVKRQVRSNYLLYLPKMYFSIKEKFPLILYLHGGMGRGDNIEKIKWYPVPKMLEKDDSLPFIVISPQCPERESWTDSETLIALLDEIIAKYRVDTERIYLIGYSMGGFGVWFLAYRYPERFAAIAPMSGMSNILWASKIKDIPAWAFHGAKDERIPASETEDMVRALQSYGSEIKITLSPERGHSPPSEAEHRELFEWLLKHRKQ